ncbi:hypothetical protein K6119_00555 [Paracrocinitomix mangrovi]|uniref:hypothetical protein n=1 Tax=Paracrocinitomix mangrovi TaxID=2862509 RepID=UPI001C8D5593|nr:hypothetical protein [Paracrocinitomix mangrovi]UKN02005.1 hypothetical protein K6119_00555 [Paracrocinitomix mangrovi]
MTVIEFDNLLTKATEFAFEFGQRYVSNMLPKSFVYEVQLNMSYDDPSLTQFDLYPEDDHKIINGLNKTEVIDLLLRKNKVPVWIDISVKDITETNTVINLLCSGRYSAEPEELYYQDNGTGPFGIKSPILPFGFKEGEKFDLKQNRKINSKN